MTHKLATIFIVSFVSFTVFAQPANNETNSRLNGIAQTTLAETHAQLSIELDKQLDAQIQSSIAQLEQVNEAALMASRKPGDRNLNRRVRISE